MDRYRFGALLEGMAARLGDNRLSFVAGGMVVFVVAFYVVSNLRGVELDSAQI